MLTTAPVSIFWQKFCRILAACPPSHLFVYDTTFPSAVQDFFDILLIGLFGGLIFFVLFGGLILLRFHFKRSGAFDFRVTEGAWFVSCMFFATSVRMGGTYIIAVWCWACGV